MTRAVDDLTAEAECTGLAASWCPRCGNCTCPEGIGGERSLNDPACPLHAPDSPHAEPALDGQLVLGEGADRAR